MKKIKIKKDNKKKQINKPEHLIKNIVTPEEIKSRLKVVNSEFKKGFDIINHYPKSVTFFGSARLKPSNKYYQFAQKLAGEICKSGYAVVTGGGPGIMEAGNRGTRESCGYAIGFGIELPFEQNINPYVTHGMNYHYFFTRKVMMTFSSEAYIYFPGGFGTLDEFFEIVTLVQTNKIPRVPIILVGKEFWNPLVEIFEKNLLGKFKTISKGDLKLFKVFDTSDESIKEILKIVKKAPLRNESNEVK